MSDSFIVRPGNKDIVFVKTESDINLSQVTGDFDENLEEVINTNIRGLNEDVVRTEAGTQVRQVVDKNELLYDHTKFNEAIEVLIKMLDRFDHFDRVFAQE